MQIERMRLELRPRNPWESADLGAVMLRAWWRPVYAALAAIMVPVALAAHLAFEDLLVALVVVWWLKPLYDRVILHVLSRAVFGVIPSVRETLQALPDLLRHSGLVGALTLRRLDPGRSFTLAVRQLEGQSGTGARNRERVLNRRVGAQTSSLAFVCASFELVTLLSLAGLVQLLTPAELETDHGIEYLLSLMFDSDRAGPWSWIGNVFVMAAFFAIEPLYVASGFGLYLNRRTTLEAWDLELRLRRLQQVPRAQHARAAALLAAATLGLTGLLLPDGALAAERSSQELIREVLAAPEFQQERVRKVWRPRTQDEGSSRPVADWLVSLATSAAETLRFLAYALLAIGFLFALRFLIQHARSGRRGGEPRAAAPQAPDALFGLDVRPESLPADLAELAMRAAGADPRLALSLLYRGALASLIHRDRLEIREGDTEADCARRVHTVKPSAGPYFERLVDAWSRTAYAHRPPGEAAVIELCGQWPQHFGQQAAGAGSA